MRRILESFILSAAVAALAALLLAGCQEGKHKEEKKPAVEQAETTVDTTEEDTLAVFFKRMWR